MAERKKIITASIWVLGAFGLSQLMRLGSNLVVTRLLEPEMFGVMAIIYVVMQGLAMFSDLGLRAFVIRYDDGLDSKRLNTIWTMQVVRGWLMFAVVVLVALFFFVLNQIMQLDNRNVYGNSELPYLLLVVGTTAIISGYTTMAPAIMSRELQRGKLELIELTAQFISIAVMLYWAWKYPSIWALVSAAVMAALIKMILTYRLFYVRHQFAWDKQVVKEVFNFGRWIFFASALTYLAMQGDKLIFSTYVSASELGVYSIAAMLAGVVSNMVEKLTSKIWFPVLSKIAKERPKELKRKYYEVRSKQDFIIFFSVGILIALSSEIIEFLYDERFYSAGWMMQIMLFGVLGSTISRLGIACLTALGKTKIRMKIMLVRSLAIFIGLPVLFYYFGFKGAIWGVALNNFVAIPIQYVEMHKQGILSLVLELRAVPVVAISYGIAYMVINKADYLSMFVCGGFGCQ